MREPVYSIVYRVLMGLAMYCQIDFRNCDYRCSAFRLPRPPAPPRIKVFKLDLLFGLAKKRCKIAR